MQQFTVIDELRGELRKRRITNKKIRLTLGICNSYISRMLTGSAAIDPDTFVFLCGMAELNPKEMKERFPLDFDSRGAISVVGYRPRDNQKID